MMHLCEVWLLVRVEGYVEWHWGGQSPLTNSLTLWGSLTHTHVHAEAHTHGRCNLVVITANKAVLCCTAKQYTLSGASLV